MTSETNPDPRVKPIRGSWWSTKRLGADVDLSGLSANGVTERSVLVELEANLIPHEFAHHKWYRIADTFFLLTLPVAEIGRLAAHPDVLFIEPSRSVVGDLDQSCPAAGVSTAVRPTGAATGYDGRGVVVGIIDWGFDFTLDDFRDEHGRTRVAYLWDQQLMPQVGERSPAEFGYGVEYDREAIDRALAAPDPFAIVRHKPQPKSHGTHVAGIAVGNGRSFDSSYKAGRYVGVAPEATIIFVQKDTRKDAKPDSSVAAFRAVASNTISVATAVAYIFEKARQLDMPCVINLSSSVQTGSHDGESVLEHLIDSLLRKKGRALVTTAGNVGASGGHASGQLRSGQSRRLSLMVDEAPIERGIEIWHRSLDRFKVRLVNPAGRATPWIEPGQEFDDPDDGSGNVVGIFYERFTPLNGDAHILIDLAPVARPAGAHSTSVSTGTWFVEIAAVDVHDGRFDAWVFNVRNSYCWFGPEDSDPRTTISTPGTGYNVITVANYNHNVSPPHIEPSSGKGPTRDGRPKPEIAAPGMSIVSSAALGGRDVEGVRMAVRYQHIGGTSQAAPHVAGAVALLFQKAPFLTSAQIRDLLIAGATRPPGVEGFNMDWGYGMLCTERSLALLDEIAPGTDKPISVSATSLAGGRGPRGSSRTSVSAEEMSTQQLVTVHAGIPIFRLADGRFQIVSHFAVASLDEAKRSAERLSSASN